MDTWLLTLTLIAFAVVLIYKFLVSNFGYWQKRGVREAKSYPLCGSFPSAFTFKRHVVYDINDIYREYKKNEYFVGTFMSRAPQLLILKPEYVHKIYVNDFKHFHDNELSLFVDEKKDVIFANNPFVLSGEKWKERRLEIVPGMTPNRIKGAYPVTLEVCGRFQQYIKKQIKMGSKDGIDTNELSLRYTSEVVTDCILGVKSESFLDEPPVIMNMVKRVFDQSMILILYQFFAGLFPSLTKFYKMRLLSDSFTKFFLNLMQQSIELRINQKIDRGDFLNYLLQLKQKKNLSLEELTSHSMTFLSDGFVTTSAAISHCLLLLARDQLRQQKLREEILKNLDKDGNINFETLTELPYLDACLHETLRLFPILFITKLCTSPYELENKNGKKVRLEVGDRVIVSAYAIHYDENIYENAAAFQPERFENGGVKKYREQGAYLGFGDGPRSCLGMRFALTQAKAALVEIVKNFEVKVNPKTRTDNFLDKNQLLAMLDGGIWLDYKSLN